MTKEAAKGAKEEVLTRFLTSVKDLGFSPEFTLTDKDWSEIDAMRAVWPEAQHQLCFWHALKAVKTHLAKNKTTPAQYNAQNAHAQFPFIQPTFVPAAQQTAETKVRLKQAIDITLVT